MSTKAPGITLRSKDTAMKFSPQTKWLQLHQEWSKSRSIGARVLEATTDQLGTLEECFESIILTEFLVLADLQKLLDGSSRLLETSGKLIFCANLVEGNLDSPKASLSELYQGLFPFFVVSEVTNLGNEIGIVASKRETAISTPPNSEISVLLEMLLAAEMNYESASSNAEAMQRSLQNQLRDAKREMRKRMVQVLQSVKAQGDVEEEVQRSKQLLQESERAKEKIFKTLSYRLGYELIHRAKSVRGLVGLPSALLDVNQEAVRRRGGRKASSSLSPQNVIGSIKKRIQLGKRDKMSQTSKSFNVTDGPSRSSRNPTSFPLPDVLQAGANATALASLKVACIMDEFTMSSFAPECKTALLDPDKSISQLQEFAPDFLFVESAWRGKTDEWAGKIGHMSKELDGILNWCQKETGIPTVFWCKEDPVHFSTFINTAARFDFVFTTDIDCVHRYMEILGHDRVYLLPFACQPATQNPIEKYNRKDGACFAGAYYLRYPERQRDFLRMVLKLLEVRPVEIYDRNFGKSDATYQFPASFSPLIKGRLDFSDIDKAYKGYKYAININSIKKSQTMFARRVFEVLASNTITVSNFSKGIQLMFGDLVITTDDADVLERRLEELAKDEVAERKLRLLGLRKVLCEHTYQDRFSYVVSKVFGQPEKALLPPISVIGYAMTIDQIESICRSFGRQQYSEKKLTLVVHRDIEQECRRRGIDATILSLEGNAKASVASVVDGRLTACFHANDYYAASYLSDLALCTRYESSLVIGKAAYYDWNQESGLSLGGEQLQYQESGAIAARMSLAAPELLSDTSLQEYVDSIDTLSFSSNSFSIDEFSYCKNGAELSNELELELLSGTLPNIATGTSLRAILEKAEAIVPSLPVTIEPDGVIGADALCKMFQSDREKMLTISHTPKGVEITSALSFKESQYVYCPTNKPIYDFKFSTVAKFYLDVSVGVGIQVVFLFFDRDNQRIGQSVCSASANHELDLPMGTAFVKLGFLVTGPGSATIKRLVLGHLVDEAPVQIFGRSKHLLLTNQYPSQTELYQNAFVHRRVLAYKELGESVDVFRFTKQDQLDYHDFDNVSVVSGGAEILKRVLQSNQYETILVHFLSESMWKVLDELKSDTKTIIWLHGAEVQHWKRREFNYSTETEKAEAKHAGERRMHFWQNVLQSSKPFGFVFVSQYLREQAEQDLGVSLGPGQVQVVHNHIDTKLFTYQPKEVHQRTQILSIRPFASRTYANDLSVEAILILSQEEFFSELDFHIIGDGELYEETVNPLRSFGNVLLEKRFLTQSEIASMHKDYGVFLVPSRMDSQGVSRDEAMASGLVPITNSVAAIPEFVDENSGILVPPEDAAALAGAIKRLYWEPDTFARLSKNAADRVRDQSNLSKTIQRELSMFCGE